MAFSSHAHRFAYIERTMEDFDSPASQVVPRNRITPLEAAASHKVAVFFA
jgi:hypothetical protein